MDKWQQQPQLASAQLLRLPRQLHCSSSSRSSSHRHSRSHGRISRSRGRGCRTRWLPQAHVKCRPELLAHRHRTRGLWAHDRLGLSRTSQSHLCVRHRRRMLRGAQRVRGVDLQGCRVRREWARRKVARRNEA